MSRNKKRLLKKMSMKVIEWMLVSSYEVTVTTDFVNSKQ